MLSRYSAGALLELSVGVRPGLVSAPTFLALLVAQATREQDGTLLPEATYAGYTRSEVATAVWSPADIPTSKMTNSSAIPLSKPLVGEHLVIGWALATAAQGGEVLHIGDLPPLLLSAAEPDPPVVPAGVLQVSVG